MLKIPRKISLILSLIIAILFLLTCMLGIIIMPKLVEMLINLPDNIGSRELISMSERSLILVISYVILLITILAVVMMIVLLMRVYVGNVFTDKSVALIRWVSWCCFGLCVSFGILGLYFQLSIIVALAAIFLGLCLRVVKNVIEEATAIKEENDLTV